MPAQETYGEGAAGFPLLTPQGSPAFPETVRAKIPEWDLHARARVGSPLVLSQGTVWAAGTEGIFGRLEAEVGRCGEGGSTGEPPQ